MRRRREKRARGDGDGKSRGSGSIWERGAARSEAEPKAEGERAKMSAGSSSSSGQTRGRGDPACPFCRTRTVVHRTSGTEANPGRKYYTCTNRDWGNSSCCFFMWKPASTKDAMEAIVMKMSAAVDELKTAMKEMQESLAAQRAEMTRYAAIGDRNSIDFRWMFGVVVAALALNLMLLVVIAMK